MNKIDFKNSIDFLEKKFYETPLGQAVGIELYVKGYTPEKIRRKVRIKLKNKDHIFSDVAFFTKEKCFITFMHPSDAILIHKKKLPINKILHYEKNQKR